MLRLVQPSWRYKKSFSKAVQEMRRDSKVISIIPETQNFTGYLRRWQQLHKGNDVPNGVVPRSDYWLVDGKHYLGMVQIRHRLTEQLRASGGHLYYEIRPSKQGRGYGRTLVSLAKAKARNLGIKKLLVSCDEDNHPSHRAIVANGGLLFRKLRIHSGSAPLLQFWLPTS